MKRRIGIVILALLFLSCIDKTFVQGVDSYTRVIIPEYKQYVDWDLRLSPDTKRIRKQSADKLQELIDEAKGVE